MELLQVIQQICSQTVSSMQPADICFGKVVSKDPLQIQTDMFKEPLRKEVLILTASVIEKKIEIKQHKHTVSGLSHSHGGSSALGGTYDTSLVNLNPKCIENGIELPAGPDWVIITRGLEVGDQVCMLSVQNGQKFVVLSRLY